LIHQEQPLMLIFGKAEHIFRNGQPQLTHELLCERSVGPAQLQRKLAGVFQHEAGHATFTHQRIKRSQVGGGKHKGCLRRKAAPDTPEASACESGKREGNLLHGRQVAIGADRKPDPGDFTGYTPLDNQLFSVDAEQPVQLLTCGRDLESAYHPVLAPDDERKGCTVEHLVSD
jgi:hypothetical protein